MNTFPPSIELMREIYRYPGEYVLVRDDRIVAHAPDIADAYEQVADVPRRELRTHRVPTHESAVTATWSAL